MSSQPEYILAGVLMKQHLAGDQTAGALSMLENRSTGPSRTPIHVHEHDDETLHMLEGGMRTIIAGKEQTVRAGETLFLARGCSAPTDECQWSSNALPSALYTERL